jgi:hypothetical protein
MRRLFWIGVGVAAAYYGSRWVRRQRERLSPGSVGARVGDMARDVGQLVRVSVDEGRRAATEREAELRAELEQQKEGPLPPG